MRNSPIYIFIEVTFHSENRSYTLLWIVDDSWSYCHTFGFLSWILTYFRKNTSFHIHFLRDSYSCWPSRLTKILVQYHSPDLHLDWNCWFILSVCEILINVIKVHLIAPESQMWRKNQRIVVFWGRFLVYWSTRMICIRGRKRKG